MLSTDLLGLDTVQFSQQALPFPSSSMRAMQYSSPSLSADTGLESIKYHSTSYFENIDFPAPRAVLGVFGNHYVTE